MDSQPEESSTSIFTREEGNEVGWWGDSGCYLSSLVEDKELK